MRPVAVRVMAVARSVRLILFAGLQAGHSCLQIEQAASRHHGIVKQKALRVLEVALQ
jgi:hypothetical protein